jgi:small neutral amino acid transporter SnatA (MarC family)
LAVRNVCQHPLFFVALLAGLWGVPMLRRRVLAAWLMTLLGATAGKVIDSLSGLILATLALQFMVEGLPNSFLAS